MRFAAIADIHGNAPALEAVLADIAARGIGDIVNLGDHVSGPMEAALTADLLMARADIVTIRGDQDRRLVELDQVHTDGKRKRIDLAQLERRHLDWLAAQPETLLWRGDIFLCHGSPVDDVSYWLDRVTEAGHIRASTRAEIEAEAQGVTASLILCAHTHIPRVVRLSDGRIVVNPGSVGLPGYEGKAPVPHKVETGTPDACYAIIDKKTSGGWAVSFHHVAYDSTSMAAMARRNGMASWAQALATGWIT